MGKETRLFYAKLYKDRGPDFQAKYPCFKKYYDEFAEELKDKPEKETKSKKGK